MIQLSGAGKRFGHKLLFENVDWLITNRDHIGLVGGNGAESPNLRSSAISAQHSESAGDLEPFGFARLQEAG